jgi:hypothetical protein
MRTQCGINVKVPAHMRFTNACLVSCPAASQVRGVDCPRPVKTWTQCGINVKVLEVLKKHGFERPLSIQAQVRGLWEHSALVPAGAGVCGNTAHYKAHALQSTGVLSVETQHITKHMHYRAQVCYLWTHSALQSTCIRKHMHSKAQVCCL